MEFTNLLRNYNLKKEQWIGVSSVALHVATLLFVAYILASLASALISSSMVELAMNALRSRDRGVTATSNVDLGRGPNYRDIRRTIMDRNLFNSGGEFPVEVDPGSENVEKAQVFDQNAPCQKSKLTLKLIGTIYLGSSTTSMATLQDPSYTEADIYKAGDTLIDNEGVTIVAVERERVVLNNGGVKECLELTAKIGDLVIGPGASPQQVKPAAAQAAASGGSVILDQGTVETLVGKNGERALNDARLVPNMADGGVNGFKIFNIKSDSIFMRVGMQNGDIVTQVNEVSLKQPDQGYAFYEAFHAERDITIYILRGAVPMTLNVQIK